MKTIIENVDKYIASFPEETQQILQQVRAAIKQAAPKAEESIGYGMPSYKYLGQLVYFAGYKNHVGFYALPSSYKEFNTELAKYKQGKGSVQFPINEKMPIALIKKMVKFRVKENEVKFAMKTNTKKSSKKVASKKTTAK